MTGKLQSHQFIDLQTGQVIPHAQILKNLEILDKTKEMLEEGSRIYHQVMKRAPGTFKQKKAVAKTRADEAAGGSRTDLWDNLADDKVIASMVVTAPPAWNAYEAHQNEKS